MQEGIPYPHISLDDFLNDEAAEMLLSSFEKPRKSESWTRSDSHNAKFPCRL